MNKIAGLPKTAHVVWDEYNDLRVENHKVVSKDPMLRWLIFVTMCKKWDQLLPQMISQGFRIEAVIEECIADMQNSEKFTRVLYWVVDQHNSYKKRVKIASSGQAKPVQQEIIAKLKTCKRWDQLFNAVKTNGDLLKKMNKKWQEIEQCDH